ncbi:hypothetical protein [Hymenobacter sp. PAMC 26628]|uniref:hypothetical protein n=1 Tax=Hymenobacter sp. PAMC 26628 TaxID=1484118 RepID=UPI00076FF7E9|nr:hypothetical protein [Hymenobacter sp. PAMC 26628]AMJ65031.1 hypothetical protein AXW84_06020 [Hymenobacter sp. PAMC 26628]
MPSTPLSAPDFLSKWTVRFDDNSFEIINEGTFREFAADIDASFAALANVPALQQSIALGAAKALLTAGTVQPLYYAIDFGADSAGHPQTVYVRGLGPAAFDTRGVLAAGGQVSQVSVSVAAGTFAGLADAAGHPLSKLALPMAVHGGQWYLTGDGIWEAQHDFAATVSPTTGADWQPVASFTGQLASNPTINATSIQDATDAGRAMLTAASAAAQLGLVDKLSIAANAYGVHPEFKSAYKQDGLLIWLLKAVAAVQNGQVVKAPPAPTGVLVDDTADTMSMVLVPGFLSLADYEVFGVTGFPGTVPASTAGANIQSGRLVMRGLTGSHLVGTVGARVAASGNRPAGASATNPEAFTGSAVVTPPPATTPYTGNYTPTANDIAAACGSAGGNGQLTTRTSTDNQNAADTAARTAALAAITCNVVTAPVSYDNTVTGGNSYKGVTLGAEAADQLEFNNASGTDNSPITMELWLSGSQVAAVPYENYYTGKPFRFTHSGQKYTKNFAPGRIDL